MAASLLNFNVGVLGHVDSGKTSLSKALSTVASTASFDKNPQSKERGITLDLGFSSFQVDVPEHVAQLALKRVQYTLVDCPGHASLIKTIIGGKLVLLYLFLCCKPATYSTRANAPVFNHLRNFWLYLNKSRS